MLLTCGRADQRDAPGELLSSRPQVRVLPGALSVFAGRTLFSWPGDDRHEALPRRRARAVPSALGALVLRSAALAALPTGSAWRAAVRWWSAGRSARPWRCCGPCAPHGLPHPEVALPVVLDGGLRVRVRCRAGRRREMSPPWTGRRSSSS